jgi:hypothetical protein
MATPTPSRADGVRARLRSLRPRRETLLVAGALVVAELLVVAWYLALTGPVADPLSLLYPFVWMDAALLAVWRTPLPAANGPRRVVALGVVAVYGLVVAYVGGLVGPGLAFGGLDVPTSFRVATRLPPGYSPAVVYLGEYLQLSVTPYKLVGYAALSYLLYVTVLDVGSAVGGGRSAVAGLLGLFSCVSCTWPILAAVLTGAFGVGASTVAAFTPELWTSTVVFVATVVLLYWRPTR